MKSSPRSSLKNRFSRFVRSVRFRLSLWYLAVLALALLLFGVSIYSIEERSLSAAIDTELSAGAEQISKVISTDGNQFKLPEQFTAILQQLALLKLPEAALGELQNLPGVKALVNGQYVVMLVDGQGKITQQFGSLTPADAGKLRSLASEAQARNEATVLSLTIGNPPVSKSQVDNTYRIQFYPVRDAASNKISGVLVLGLWWEGATTLNQLRWTLLLAGLATLLLTAGGGYWLASQAMRPVDRITRTAQAIGESDLSRRIRLKSRDELGELAATFDRMLDRLENAFERQRQFTADASHELRTPLTIINLEVSRLAQRSRTVADYERALSIIQAENDYMTHLVNDLLILARSDSGPVQMKLERLDLSDLALEVVERLAPLAKQNQVELVTGDLPEVEISGNRLYLTRLLANLVENGIKYTAGKGSQVEIETGISSEGNSEKPEWAWLRVRDDGPGIAPEHLPYLFHRFYQIDEARGSQKQSDQNETRGRGSGLGLSIVQRIAELHLGTVKVKSEVGQGSTFEVWLPLTPSPDLNEAH